MSRRLITTVTSSVLVSVGLIVGYLASAGAVSAMPAPAPDGGGAFPNIASPAPTITVVHHGSSVWPFVLVALVAVAATLAASVAVASIRRSRRRLQPA
ncbi:MAG TPA: hypothetical protein VGJ59_02385 [Jatrophihabitantaceae bacterium]|jgi:hypothetical protein